MNSRHQRVLMMLIFYLLFVEIRASSFYDEFQHNCVRTCRPNDQRLCEYNFYLEWYTVLSKACFDCPRNKTDCSRPQCVSADGVNRPIMSVNRQLPGPSIQVCENDIISVTVHNEMQSFEGVSIHWHGIHQRETPWMDGISKLTQCPISTTSNFEYRFPARLAGTYFWHAHSGLQRADGIFGSLVIRKPIGQEQNSQLYDDDLPQHVIMIHDWSHETASSQYAHHFYGQGGNKPPSMLINGKGVHNLVSFTGALNSANLTYAPRAVFNVRQGRRYRFRITSNALLGCPISFSIDNHTLTVIATDGVPFEPIDVNSLVITSGERYDFVINANKDVANYLIRLQGNLDCGATQTRCVQSAILNYEGAQNISVFDDLPNPSFDAMGSQESNPKQLNSVNTVDDPLHVSIASLNATKQDLPGAQNLNRKPDHVFLMAYDFEKINNTDWYDPTFYPLPLIDPKYRVYTPQINFLSMMLPTTPMLYQFNDIPSSMLCNNTQMSRDCAPENNKYCKCVHTLKVKIGDLVEVILLDKGITFDTSHPFHMHGDYFRIIAIGKMGKSLTIEDYNKMEANGTVQRRFGGILKDTVAVPDGGYAILRFEATNPGVWLFHCHLEHHTQTGMGFIFQIGNPEEWPKVPDKYERCASWKPDYSNSLSYIPINAIPRTSQPNASFSFQTAFYVFLGISIGLACLLLISLICITDLFRKVRRKPKPEILPSDYTLSSHVNPSFNYSS